MALEINSSNRHEEPITILAPNDARNFFDKHDKKEDEENQQIVARQDAWQRLGLQQDEQKVAFWQKRKKEDDEKQQIVAR